MPKIAMPTQTVDMATGAVTEGACDWHFALPDFSDGKCPECATKHEPDLPHNNQSLAYQYLFRSKHGRWPTWADAMSHCSPEMQAAWKVSLIEKGAWSEPAAVSS